MTKSEFLKIKIKAFKPQFKQLVGLNESDKTSELIDFMVMLHPNTDKQYQGSRGEVFGRNHFVFTIYTTGILRTKVETGAKLFYPF